VEVGQQSVYCQWHKRPLSETRADSLSFPWLPKDPRTRVGWIDTLSHHYDAVAFGYDHWDLETWSWLIEQFHQRGVKVGIYTPTINVYEWSWKAYLRGRWEPGSYHYEWNHRLAPHFARTTELDPATAEPDTFATWFRAYNGDYSDECVAAFVSLCVDFLSDWDWLMLDWCSIQLYDLKKWQPQAYSDTEYGELDFDQNGVPHSEDTEERLWWIGQQIKMVEQLDQALPEMLLVPNGNLAAYWPEFAVWVNGCYVERAPNQLNSPYSRKSWKQVLDPEYERSLFKLTEPGYFQEPFMILLEDRLNESRYPDRSFSFIAALFDGVYHLVRVNPDCWKVTHPPDLGLGSAEKKCWKVDNTLSRVYTGGEVWVDIQADSRFTGGVWRPTDNRR